MKKSPLLLLGAGWLVCLLAVAAIVSFTRGAPPPRAFDQAQWLAHRATAVHNPRRLMIDEIKELLPPGAPKAEVDALLGPPDWFGAMALEYHLGATGAGGERRYLAISFDTQRRVVRHNMTEH